MLAKKPLIVYNEMAVQEIIRTKSSSYKRYEELLIKKDKLIKEAEGYRVSYEGLFDSLNKEVYAARIECVKKRKIISYCKSLISQKKTIIRKNLDEFVDKAMSEYQETLDFLQDKDDSRLVEKEKISPTKGPKELKVIYHRLAKLVHPDMNPEFKDDLVIQDLWNRANVAYNLLNAIELEELEVLINKYLESINHDHYEIEIEDINEKIFNLNREIFRITHTNPYQYKFLLDDKEGVQRKKDELNKELDDYKRYLDELGNEIKEFEYLIEEE